MRMYIKNGVLLLAILFAAGSSYAQEHSLPPASLVSEPQAQRYYPWNPDLSFVPKMVLFITPEVEAVKTRSETATAMIEFKKGSFVIDPLFGRNPKELQKIDTLVSSVIGNDLINLKRVYITGYCSIEGSYAANETLSKRRAEGFAQYIQKSYTIEPRLVGTNFVAEDWDGLVKLIQEGTMQYKEEVLAIISRVSIDNGREKRLMNLHGGAPYRYMLSELYPSLRRISIEADYVVRPVPTERIRQVFESRPALLSLEEMYRIAPKYGDNPGEYQKFYETVARHYPSDVVANNNAAAAALLNKDVVTARYYLDKIATDPRSSINRATLLYIGSQREASRDEFHRGWDAGYGTRLSSKIFELTPIPAEPVGTVVSEPATEGASKEFTPRFALKTNLLFDVGSALNLELEVPLGKRWSVAAEVIFPWWLLSKDQYCLQSTSGNVELRHWFGHRVNRPLLTGWFVGVYGGGGNYDIEWKTKGYQGDYFTTGVSGGYAHSIGKNLRMEYSLGVGYLETDYKKYEAVKGVVDDDWHLILQDKGTQSWVGPTRAKISLVWMINGHQKK